MAILCGLKFSSTTDIVSCQSDTTGIGESVSVSNLAKRSKIDPSQVIAATYTDDAKKAADYCKRYARLTGQEATGRMKVVPSSDEPSIFLCKQIPIDSNED